MRRRPSDGKPCHRCGTGRRCPGTAYCRPCTKVMRLQWEAGNAERAAATRRQWQAMDPDR